MKCSSRKNCKRGRHLSSSGRRQTLNEVQFPKELQGSRSTRTGPRATRSLNDVQFPKELQVRTSLGSPSVIALNEVQFPKELQARLLNRVPTTTSTLK